MAWTPSLLVAYGRAVAMGMGIWCMHYIGMLAYRLPVPVFYHWPTVLASFLAAVAAAAVALFVVSRSRMGRWSIGIGSLLMAPDSGDALHRDGSHAVVCDVPLFAGNRVAVDPSRNRHFAGGVVVDLLSAADKHFSGWRKPASSLLMGAAIPVMHYTGMAAVTFTPMASNVDLTHSIEMTSIGTLGIVAGSLTILAIAILALFVQKTRDALAESEERLRLTLHSSGVAVWSWEIVSNVITADENWAIQFGLPIGQFPKAIEGFSALVHPEDRERVHREVDASIKSRDRTRRNSASCWLTARSVSWLPAEKSTAATTERRSG